MNNLSIILYLIDVLGNLQGLLIAISVFGLFGTVFVIAVYYIGKADGDQVLHGCIPILCTLIVSLAALIATAIPSKQTMQMIAVSEASEMVIMNDEVREVMTDIKDVFKTQLGKLKE